VDGESAESPPALENEVVLAAERPNNKYPLTLVMITANASEQSKNRIRKRASLLLKKRLLNSVRCGRLRNSHLSWKMRA
jgi:hypothetical protein